MFRLLVCTIVLGICVIVGITASWIVSGGLVLILASTVACAGGVQKIHRVRSGCPTLFDVMFLTDNYDIDSVQRQFGHVNELGCILIPTAQLQSLPSTQRRLSLAVPIVALLSSIASTVAAFTDHRNVSLYLLALSAVACGIFWVRAIIFGLAVASKVHTPRESNDPN